jgi:hypothetical protein
MNPNAEYRGPPSISVPRLDHGQSPSDAPKSFPARDILLGTMDCPWCGDGEYRVRYRVPDFRIVACPQCRLLYNRDFPPSDENGGDIFSGEYYDEVQKEAFEHARDPASSDPSTPIYETGLSVVEERAGKGRLLDVGCAFGSFLDLSFRARRDEPRSLYWDANVQPSGIRDV